LEEATDREPNQVKKMIEGTFKTSTGKSLAKALLSDTLDNSS